MPTLFTMLLPSRTPKTTIAGLHLLRDQTQHLFNGINLLTRHISDQIAEIPQLNNAQVFDCTEHFLRILTSIQQRQGTIHTQLASLVKSTSTSTEPWIHEIDDIHQAVLRKVVQCNRRSRGDDLGRKDGAMKYWPYVAESLELLKPLLQRLHEDIVRVLDDEEVWVHSKATNRKSFGWFKTPQVTARPDAKGRNVGFARDVRARSEVAQVEGGGELVYRECVVPLTSDRKRTAGKFKTRRGLVEEGSEDVEEWSGIADHDCIEEWPV
jgi:hypothetical protein